MKISGWKKWFIISIGFVVKVYMNFVKKDFGVVFFDIFMSVNGDVILMFVIDNIGSMWDEI